MNFYDLKKTLTPGVILTLAWGYIKAITTPESNKYIYMYQVSGERLQGHWSSGSINKFVNHFCSLVMLSNDQKPVQSKPMCHPKTQVKKHSKLHEEDI